jgi:hypothetical protein
MAHVSNDEGRSIKTSKQSKMMATELPKAFRKLRDIDVSNTPEQANKSVIAPSVLMLHLLVRWSLV